jgi:hypothetical protein
LTISAITTASDPKLYSSKLSFLSALNPPCSNLVTLFKSSLPITNPPQNSKFLLTSLLKTLLLLVTSQALSAYLPILPASPLNQSLLLPHPSDPHDSDPPSSTPADTPKHLPPFPPSTVVTIDPEPLAPQEPTLPAFPSALVTPSPFSSPPASHTHNHTSSQARPAHLLPLWELAGADSIIRVHVPFSMTDLSQIEKRLNSLSNDSNSYIKEFKYLAQAYDMTWHETHLSRME